MTLIDVIFAVAVVFGVALLARSMEAASKAQQGETPKDPCPPHKWDYENITNVDGTVTSRMRCLKCKNYPGQY